jgi:hypothetical protein
MLTYFSFVYLLTENSKQLLFILLAYVPLSSQALHRNGPYKFSSTILSESLLFLRFI